MLYVEINLMLEFDPPMVFLQYVHFVRCYSVFEYIFMLLERAICICILKRVGRKLEKVVKEHFVEFHKLYHPSIRLRFRKMEQAV